jgi:hypothetical protein
VRRIRQASNLEELASTLVDASGGFASGAAFLRIEDRQARGERIRGVPEESADRFPSIRVPLDSAAAMAGAVESRDPVTAVASEAQVSAEMLSIAAPAQDLRVSIFPILARGDVRALLYAWGGVQAPATELLCQVAGAAWAALDRPAAPPAALPELVEIVVPKVPTRSSWESVPPEEQQLHLRAQRFARVQVAEIRLSHGQAVQTGRLRRDLYDAVGGPIDDARKKFRDTFVAASPGMVDYLHLELVRTLANDDAELLGKDYPGPLV